MFWQCCDSVVTVLWQRCDSVVTVLWQWCDSDVTVLWQCPDIMSSVFGVINSWNLSIFSSEKLIGGWVVVVVVVVAHLIIVSLQVHDCNIPIMNRNFRVFLMTWPEPDLEFDPCRTSGRPELNLTWPWSSTKIVWCYLAGKRIVNHNWKEVNHIWQKWLVLGSLWFTS